VKFDGGSVIKIKGVTAKFELDDTDNKEIRSRKVRLTTVGDPLR
jgi:hypothetical protein